MSYGQNLGDKELSGAFFGGVHGSLDASSISVQLVEVKVI
jgi:hypothetical protein